MKLYMMPFSGFNSFFQLCLTFDSHCKEMVLTLKERLEQGIFIYLLYCRTSTTCTLYMHKKHIPTILHFFLYMHIICIIIVFHFWCFNSNPWGIYSCFSKVIWRHAIYRLLWQECKLIVVKQELYLHLFGWQ